MQTYLTDRLKRLYSKGVYDDEFVQAAIEDLPFLFGRLDLLEEFFETNAPGTGERSMLVAKQLRAHPAQPPITKPPLWRRVALAFR